MTTENIINKRHTFIVYASWNRHMVKILDKPHKHKEIHTADIFRKIPQLELTS